MGKSFPGNKTILILQSAYPQRHTESIPPPDLKKVPHHLLADMCYAYNITSNDMSLDTSSRVGPLGGTI
eukprot:8999234-Ditylum_brightwellii.AAC.1